MKLHALNARISTDIQRAHEVLVHRVRLPRQGREHGTFKFFAMLWDSKKGICTLAALLLAGALAAPAMAASSRLTADAGNRQVLYSRDADDFLNLDTVSDGSIRPLSETVYSDRGSYKIQVRVKAGYGLSAGAIEGDIAVKSQKLYPDTGSREQKYDYYLLTLTPAALDTDAPEDFTLSLKSGDASCTLRGTMQISEVLPLFDGLRYSANSGRFFRFDEPIEEEAQVSRSSDLTLLFSGDYGDGDDIYDLAMDTAIPQKAITLLGCEALAAFRFTDSPSFSSPVTVRLRAPEGITLYELRGGRLYKPDATYENGCYLWKTKKLSTYLYRLPENTNSAR